MATLHIKNMVCNRCIMVVSQELERQGLHPERVVLGEATIKEDDLTHAQLQKLDAALISLGFERIDDRKARLIEGIKNKVIQMIHHTDKVDLKFNWSSVLSEEMHYEYNYLSNLFSSVEGITLEQYIIRQKIEKVKELIFYDELNLSEIAARLGYSSVAHLSGQFKKVTGFTPSELKRSRDIDKNRKPLDAVSWNAARLSENLITPFTLSIPEKELKQSTRETLIERVICAFHKWKEITKPGFGNTNSARKTFFTNDPNEDPDLWCISSGQHNK